MIPTANARSLFSPFQNTNQNIRQHMITSSPQGESPIQKPDHHTRILLQNMNSLKLHTPSYLQESLKTINSINVDISLMTETGYNSQRPEVYKTLWTSAKAISDSAMVITSSVPTSTNIKFQPGGTATIVHGKWIVKIKSKHRDDVGRWTWLEIFRKQQNPLFIINSYMPCMQTSPGPTTYQSQIYQQYPDIQTIHQVRDRCWKDLP